MQQNLNIKLNLKFIGPSKFLDNINIFLKTIKNYPQIDPLKFVFDQILLKSCINHFVNPSIRKWRIYVIPSLELLNHGRSIHAKGFVNLNHMKSNMI